LMIGKALGRPLVCGQRVNNKLANARAQNAFAAPFRFALIVYGTTIQRAFDAEDFRIASASDCVDAVPTQPLRQGRPWKERLSYALSLQQPSSDRASLAG